MSFHSPRSSGLFPDSRPILPPTEHWNWNSSPPPYNVSTAYTNENIWYHSLSNCERNRKQKIDSSQFSCDSGSGSTSTYLDLLYDFRTLLVHDYRYILLGTSDLLCLTPQPHYLTQFWYSVRGSVQSPHYPDSLSRLSAES